MRKRRAARATIKHRTHMSNRHEPRTGDKILDKYSPNLSGPDREIARSQLYEFVAWHIRILARQHREQLDSRDQRVRDTLDLTS